MRPALVRIIDVGGHRSFAASASFAESLIDALQAPEPENPRAEIEFVRTLDWETVVYALTAPATIVRLMGHGSNLEDEVGLYAEGDLQQWSLHDMAEHCWTQGTPIDAGVVVADACDTGRARFRRGVRDLLHNDTGYIGTSRQVDWFDGTAYMSAFYTAFFRTRGKGQTIVDRGADAARRASEAYEATLGRKSPYGWSALTPSRDAVSAWGRGDG